MRAPILSLLAAVALAPAAYADTTADARSATGACLAAIIDNAPVGDVQEGDIAIRRGKDPVSCTVLVTGGQPVVIRDAVLQAIAKRPESLLPAKSRWDPEAFATRETFCNLPGRRNVMATVSTGKPGTRNVLVATVLETKARDPRCDRDLGLQKLPAEPAVASADPAPAKPAAATPPAAPVKARKGVRKWLKVPWSHSTD